MISIETILVPTDFSEPSERALAYAVDLAESLRSKIVVLHSFEPPIPGFVGGGPLTSDVTGRIVAASRKALADAAARHRQRKVEIGTLLRQGDPPEVVLAAAKDLSADLIVMGTHGRRGVARALIGSVTECVVRASPVPVLTVHAGAELSDACSPSH